jgi:hypothetical protein
MFGAISFRSCSHLPAIAYSNRVNPVTPVHRAGEAVNKSRSHRIGHEDEHERRRS